MIRVCGLLLFEVMANASKYFCGASVLNCTLVAILSFFEIFAASFVRAQPNDQGPNSSLIDLSGLGISGSPARVEAIPGTGELGEWLGIPADSAWRLGGIWLGNASAQLGGGLRGFSKGFKRLAPGFAALLPCGISARFAACHCHHSDRSPGAFTLAAARA